MELNKYFSKEKINSGRDEKEESLGRNGEEEAPIKQFKGSTSNEYNETVPKKLEELIDEAIKQHGDWVEEKIDLINSKLPSESNFTLQEIKDGFKTTLQRRIRQMASSENMKPEKWINEVNLQDLFDQAAFDYIQSLKSAAKSGDTKKNIMKFGELSYMLNPDIINSLENKYPDVDSHVIKIAALNNPTNPEKFMKFYTQKLTDLTKKYSDIDESIIKRAVAKNSRNPEKFIEGYIKRVADLTEKYPDIDQFVIKRAATNNPKDPEKFLENYKQNIADLAKKYSDVDQFVIKEAALHNPTNPEKFIKNYKQDVTNLTEKYPDIDQTVIKHAALHNPNNPEKFVDDFITKLSFLIKKYPSVNKPDIKETILSNPIDPETAIKKRFKI